MIKQNSILIKLLFFVVFFVLSNSIIAQNNENTLKKNNLKDSIPQDTTKIKKKSKTDPIKEPVFYEAKDSLMFSMKEQKMYIYGEGGIKSNNMDLKSENININMLTHVIVAYGKKDTTGKELGKPVFKQGSDVFDSDTIKFNYKTKKGYVKDVISQQSGGYLHGRITKMYPDKSIHVKDGKFTTCDRKHPHFYIELTKAKVIPGDKIVSGPLYFVIEDVPLPLGLPFGFFPNKKTSTSGIIIPTYGEEKLRGFYLRDGGYYFAISDHMDLTTTFEVYSLGGWGGGLRSNFMKRYAFTGNFDMRYSKNVTGDKEVPSSYSESTSFWVNASYMQDVKSNPTSNFSASLNFGTSNYKQFNSRTINDRVQNTTQSTVSYRKTWLGTPFNFSANASSYQNTTTRDISLNLPSMTFTVNRIMPFKRKDASGDQKWYEKIGFSYNSEFKNSISTKDSLLFKSETIKKLKYGFQHSIPISTSFNILKYFIVSPSINFTGRAYPNYISKRLAKNSSGKDTLIVDTLPRFSHNFDYSLSTSVSTKVYGMVQFKNFPIMAIRHVLTPSISYSYRPDFGAPSWGYYRNDPADSIYHRNQYSIYENGIFGGPPRGKSGSIGISLGNTLEMKVKNSADTATGFTKVTILESFNVNANYNIAADSMRWSDFSFSGSTRFLNNTINVSFSGIYSPYQYDSLGRDTKYYLIENKGQLLRFKSMNLSANATFDANSFKGKDDTQQNKGNDNKNTTKSDYAPFNMTWSIQMGYTLGITKTEFDTKSREFKTRYNQTFNFSINLSPTKNWRLGLSSGYDFDKKDLISSSLNIYRDLHCWEMSIYAIPFGSMQSYNFRINIKSPMFKGIEYKKEKTWWDNYQN